MSLDTWAPKLSIIAAMDVNIPANMFYIIPREEFSKKIYIEMANQEKVDIEKINEIGEMLNNRRWAKDCLRCNIALPEQITQRGKVKIALVQSEVLHEKEANSGTL